jgi:hypothetical protein
MKTKFEFHLKTIKALGIMFPSGVVGSFVAVPESANGTHRRFNDVRSYVGSWG